jgi:ribosomal protein L37AE/L43A
MPREEKETSDKPPCPKCELTAYVKVRKGLPNECTRCNISF